MRSRTKQVALFLSVISCLLGNCFLGGGRLLAQTSISVVVSPKAAGTTVGQTASLIATVSNDSQNNGVTWSAPAGSFSPSATASGAPTGYTAPTSAGVYTVTATSVSDPTKSASLTIGVTDLAGVFTYHNDPSRDGSNTSEYTLTPSSVSSTTFGKLFSCTVDGAIYAQPLWVANLTVNGTKHNVVFVATQHDSLYAFDADLNTTPCAPLWHVSLIDAAHGGSSSETTVPSGIAGSLVGAGYGDIAPEVGVVGTPVIDPTSHTLYVVSKSVIPSGPTFYQRLHAIDLSTGQEKTGSPVTIAGTYPGTAGGGTTVTFSARQQNQRPGLALVNGVVYISWAAHEDAAPYYGWVIGYNAANLSQTAVLNVSPNAGYSGIWMSGGTPAADSNNNLYLTTGNGNFDANSSTAPNNDYGDSFLKITSGLTVSQYFGPSNQASDNANDQDFGAGGPMVLADQPSGPMPHLVIGGGKDGYLYLLNRDSLGGIGDGNAWQRFNFGSGIYGTGAFWNNTFYMAGAHGHLQAFSFNTATGKFNTANVSQSTETYGFPGSTPSVSAEGTTNGIVWALDNTQYCTQQSPGCGPAVLRAYNAGNLATELWNSTMGTGNAAGNAVKFTVPTVANGKVYVGTRGNNTGGSTTSTTVPGELDVYGLLGTPALTATPIFSPAGGTYASSQSVTISDATSGAAIYYTTNGTMPTTASTKYTGAISVAATETVQAIAVASGMTPSAVATSTYMIQVATPIFSPAPGIYAAAQSVTITDTTPNSTIYYTLDGTTPTTSSSPYSGPIFVGSTETLTAIAVASGLVNSQPLAGLYTISSTGGTSINFPSGFGAGNMTLLSAAKLSGTSLRITDGGTNEVSAAWYPNPINIQNFTTDFTFLITPGSSPTADGFAFVIQGIGTAAIGPFGGGLGYGPDTTSGSPGIGMSVAVKFDLYSNAGEGADSTGLYTNGASPTTPFIDLSTSPIDLHSGHAFKVHMTYDGANLTMTITDTTTNGVFAKTWGVNIPAIVGGNAAFVGFTGGTGGLTAVQDIQNWTFSASVTQSQAATPTFSPAGGTYSNAQNVTISTTTPGATIYYTTDGSTPTTSSSKYSGAAAVGATETLNAIAVAPGYTNSAVGSASYAINTGGGSTINYSAGFSTSGLVLNGSAALSGTRLRLTNSGNNQAGSAWFNTPVTVTAFTTDFTFQLSSIGTSAFGNGITFVIQNAGTNAVGPSGGGLGYGPDKVTSPSASPNLPIGKSVAVKFDIVNNSGEGTNSTGLYQNGASPTMPAITPTGGVNLRSGDTFRAHISYDGTTLTLTLTDQVNTSQTFSTSWAVNIPTVVGGATAYVGFTGGTGASVANQDIITWTFGNGAALQAPVITSATTVGGTIGVPFSYQITATNSPTSFNATGLPAGLAVNTSTGLISGTPTAAGTSNVTISATNSGGTGSASLTLTVNPVVQASVIVYHTTTLPAVSSGPTFRQFSDLVFPDGTGTIIDASASGDNVTFTVNIPTAGTYDIQLSYKAYTTRGISQLSINGTKVGSTSDQYATTAALRTFDYGTYNFSSAGNYSFKFTVTGKNTSSSGYTISFDDLTLTPQSTVAMAAPVITSSGTASGTVGTNFSYQITATNSPTSFNATGLPAALAVNTSTGLISGTPTAAGTSNVTISATNSGGTGQAPLTLTINPVSGSIVSHTIQISNTADDGYYDGAWHSTAGYDLVGSTPTAVTAWATGYRFPSVGANSGDTIQSAYVELVSSDNFATSSACGSVPTTPCNNNYTFRVYGVAQDDGSAFSGTAGNTPLDVPKTSAYTDYTTTGPGDASHGSCQGNNSGQNTCTHVIDVTNIVREITSRPGWTNASAMRFVMVSTNPTTQNIYAGYEDLSGNASRAATLFVNPGTPTVVSSAGWGTGANTSYPLTYKLGPYVYPGASTLLLFLGDYYNFYSQPIPQPTISDSCGNAWNVLAGPTNWAAISYDMRSTVYYVQNPAACPAGDTIQITLSVQEPIFLHFLAITGSDTTSVPVVSAITNPSPGTYTTTATSNAVALSKPGLLVSWIFGDSDAPHVFTPQGGFVTDLNSTPTYLTAVYESVSSPGSYQSQFSISPSDGWQLVIVGLHAP